MKLASVRIVTENPSTLTSFYRTITKTDPIFPFGGADYAELQTEGSTLALVSVAGVNRYNAGAATPAANHSAILEFEVDDVDAERRRLQDCVSDWVQEPTDQPWGNRSMLFRDPDGNLINFYTPASPASES
ncbi:VOC family protein [Amycolatopsis sp. cmx-4-61]|uniref:VOC family protein n=1 Tax=Amycolatopsis sp. cmx-4-61 TaxID=2790937 RepID=UPI00397E4CDE